MKIAILGARGQLGQDLCRVLRGDIIPLGRPEADLTRPTTIDAALRPHRPDVVVNCAAYNFVDRAEDEPQEAFATNALGVRTLAVCCRDLECTLIHFSTDHVFGLNADRRIPYAETDAPGPLSAYGASKLAGEYFVQSLCPRHFVIRTCGLYGMHGQGGKGSNFVETILRRASGGPGLRVVDDQACTPTATADLALAAAALLAADAFGLYHVTNAGACTWYEFANAIVRHVGLPAEITPISSVAFGAKARRPHYSVLDCAKVTARGLPVLRPWQDALRDYLATRPGR